MALTCVKSLASAICWGSFGDVFIRNTCHVSIMCFKKESTLRPLQMAAQIIQFSEKCFSLGSSQLCAAVLLHFSFAQLDVTVQQQKD